MKLVKALMLHKTTNLLTERKISFLRKFESCRSPFLRVNQTFFREKLFCSVNDLAKIEAEETINGSKS